MSVGLRIVFMGTPAFAVRILDELHQSQHQIVGVVTVADKPAGRGQLMHQSAVKTYALSHQLPLLQPDKLRDDAFLAALQKWQADVFVVVAFRMLPEKIWSFPPMGTLNVHGSLLRQYRGAAPINWAIINGEKETGVTTFQLQHAIDTGAILLQEKIAIHPHMTAGELHDNMMHVGAKVLVKTLEGLFDNTLIAKPQDASDDPETLKHAPKIFTKDCEIDWTLPVEQIHNVVRGLAPFPGAITKVEGKTVKLYSTSIEIANPAENPGTWLTDGKTFAKFACSNGYLVLNDIQWEGKKRMSISDFLRGYRPA